MCFKSCHFSNLFAYLSPQLCFWNRNLFISEISTILLKILQWLYITTWIKENLLGMSSRPSMIHILPASLALSLLTCPSVVHYSFSICSLWWIPFLTFSSIFKLNWIIIYTLSSICRSSMKTFLTNPRANWTTRSGMPHFTLRLLYQYPQHLKMMHSRE